MKKNEKHNVILDALDKHRQMLADGIEINEHTRKEIIGLLTSTEFRCLSPKTQEIYAIPLASAMGNQGERCFIIKVFPHLVGQGELELKDNRKRYEEAVARGPRVKNFDLTALLDSGGKLNNDLLKFSTLVKEKNQGKAFVNLPTIASKKRLNCATDIAWSCLRLGIYDKLFLSAQACGNNEHRLKQPIAALETLMFNELSKRQKDAPDIEKQVKDLMNQIELIKISQYVFRKNNKLLLEPGVFTAGKSQNIWSILQIIRERHDVTKSFVYFTDDDYCDMNTELDAAFHFLAGVMRLVKTYDELNQLLNSFIKRKRTPVADPKLLRERTRYTWDIMNDCVCARTGGVRQKVSPELVKDIESGEERRRNFAQTLLAALVEFKGDGGEETSWVRTHYHRLQNILITCIERDIFITPKMLKEKAGLLELFLIQLPKNIVKDKKEAQYAIHMFRAAYADSFKLSGPGGRVTADWKRIATLCGRELGLDQLSYPLMGNFSISLANILGNPGMLGVGYAMETTTNFEALMAGGMVTCHDMHHTHMPHDWSVIMGKGGMAPKVLSAFAIKLVECQGTKGYRKIKGLLRADDDCVSIRIPHVDEEGQDQTDCQYPFDLTTLYPVDSGNITSRQFLEIEWSGLIGSTVKIQSAEQVLFFYNRINSVEPLPLLPSPGLTPVIATASTMAELKACLDSANEALEVPVIIENGSAIVFPQSYLGGRENLAGCIETYAVKNNYVIGEENGCLLLELTERISPKSRELKYLFDDIQNKLHKLDPNYRNISLLPFVRMSDAQLRKLTPLNTREEIKRARERWYITQPFWIKIPKDSDVEVREVLDRLPHLVKNYYYIGEGTQFLYLSPIGVSEGQAAKVLQEIYATYYGVELPRIKLAGLGQCPQKNNLLGVTDISFYCYDNEGKFDHKDPNLTHTILREPFPDAVKILYGWLKKAINEKDRE